MAKRIVGGTNIGYASAFQVSGYCHYMNQWWNIVNSNLTNNFKWNFVGLCLAFSREGFSSNVRVFINVFRIRYPMCRFIFPLE